ncbi:MAG: tetratricopeptide (TPR) repeat protein [Planctomycetota bacterium]|jgi:tetratricopeptide (TPR) repeat protein
MRMRRLEAAFEAAALLLACLCGSAPADVLVMKDGQILDEVKLDVRDESVIVSLQHGDIEVALDLVQECLVEGVSSYIPRTAEEKQKYEKGLVPFEGHWVTEKKRKKEMSKRIAERRKAIEEMRAHSEWGNRYKKKSKRFDFNYTIPQHVFEELEKQLDAYFSVFAKDWKVNIKKHGKISGRLTMNIYGNRKEYIRTAGSGRFTLGYFKFIGEYDLNIYYDALDPEGTRDVMFHEVGHYLHKLIDQGFRYPHWPGESLAEYYGAGYWDEDKEKLVIGLIQEGRLTEIKSDISRDEWIGLEELILKDRYEDYTWGWSLVHFLMNDERYASKFKKFFLGLATAKDIDRTRQSWGAIELKVCPSAEVYRAFKDYLGLKTDEDVKQLEREWHTYVDHELQLETASGLEKAAVKAWRSEGRMIRAKRLFREAIDSGSTNAQTYYHFGTLLYGEGEKAEAAKMLERAIELSPLHAEYYWSLAYAIRKKDKERSKKLCLMAKELDPDVRQKSALDG